MSRNVSRARRRAVPALRPPRPASRCGEQGLVTLEWLLLVGAVAGLAAYSVLAVQRVLDDTAEVPADPSVRLIDADIAAALIAAEANEAALAGVTDFTDFQARCTQLSTAFDDVVASVGPWETPTTTPPNPPALDHPAKCPVTPRQNLDGP